jgi:Ca2+-binding EF-hand superfamily protein
MHKHKPAILRAYKAADKSKDGFIQFREFAGLIQQLAFYDDLYLKFQALDRNGDRRLSFEEFKQGHKMLGLPAGNDAELRRTFDALDANSGGYLLFDEFCTFFTRKLAAAQ